MRSRPVFVTVAALTLVGPAAPAFAGKPPAPVFSVGPATMIEAFGPTYVSVTRTGNLKKAATVELRRESSDLTNAAGFGEFGTETSLVRFARNEWYKYELVNAVDDTDVEGDETYRVTLQNPSTGTVGPSAYVTIADDDGPGGFTVGPGETLSIADGSLTGCNSLLAYLADDDGFNVLSLASFPACITSPTTAFFHGATWVNTSVDPVHLRIALYDYSCGNDAYYADGTSDPAGTDHAASWGSTAASVPFGVAILDAGGTCEYDGVAAQPNSASPGNLQASSITILPAPAP